MPGWSPLVEVPDWVWIYPGTGHAFYFKGWGMDTEYIAYYHSIIFDILKRRRNLDWHTKEDLAQDVMVLLLEYNTDFTSKGLIKKMTISAYSDYMRQRYKRCKNKLNFYHLDSFKVKNQEPRYYINPTYNLEYKDAKKNLFEKFMLVIKSIAIIIRGLYITEKEEKTLEFFADNNYEETAKLMGVKRVTVDAHLRNIRLKIQKVYDTIEKRGRD